MGMRTLFSDSGKSGNPDPCRFRLVSWIQYGSYILAKVNYPDCTGFEGNKLLVFKGLSVGELTGLSVLDPHFTIDGRIIARFRPDLWADAESFIKGLAGK